MPTFYSIRRGTGSKLPVTSVSTAGMVVTTPCRCLCLLLGYAPINVSPHLPPPPFWQKVGFDLILLKNMPQIRGI